jgi:hypothetical protein
MFDRYVMFLSADFFVPFWASIAGASMSGAGAQLTQSSAREVVRLFMDGNDVYWDIDFSQERSNRSLAQFLARIDTLEPDDRDIEKTMRDAFCGDPKEQKNVQFAMGFLSRIARDRVYRVEVRLGPEDGDAVAEALALSGQDLIDEEQLELEWSASRSEWDQRIRGLTPDLPEYTATNFKSVYRAMKALPDFVSRLSDVVGSENRPEVLRRLNDRMSSQFPARSSLDVPSSMLVDR